MIILHAAWFEGNLYLWGEKSSNLSGNLEGHPGRIGRPEPHPLDTGIKGLREALKAFSAELPVSKKRTQTLSAWLPTAEKQACPFLSFARGIPRSRDQNRPSPLDRYRTSVDL